MAIDTNRYVDFAKGIPEVVERFRRAEEIVIPFVVLGELRAGFAAGARTMTNEANFGRFLASTRVSVACADVDTTHFYARLFLQLRRSGTPIPSNDLWIAALVVQHDLILFARDAHFGHLGQIPRI